MNHETHPPHVLLQQAEFVRVLARSLLGDEHLAEDVVQETWVSAIERSPSHVENVRAWLATVARNFAWRTRRAESRREQRERDAARPEAIELEDATDAGRSETTLRSVTDAVLALDEPYRATILLRYFEGLDPAEIAARQGVSIATVRSRLQRAFAKLRARLDREYGDRSAWSIGLAGLLGSAADRNANIHPSAPSPTPALASSTSLLGTGVMLMGVKVKLALVAGALVLGWMLWQQPWKQASSTPALANGQEHPRTRLDESTSPSIAVTDAASARAPIADTVASSATSNELDTFGSLAVHVVYAETGLPAGEDHLSLTAWGEPEPHLNPLSGVTDSNGDFRFERVHSGKVEVFEHHGTGERLEVAPAKETRAVLSIPRGVTVDGIVVDASGIPVSSASVWISGPHNVWEWAEIAATNRDGAFQLQHVKPGRQIAAREDQRGPSQLYPVRGSAGETCKLRIVLAEEAARVEGRVLDTKGAPIAGARVRLNDAHEGRGIFRGDHLLGTPMPERRTDEDGRFTFAGVSPPGCHIDFRAIGFAPAWLYASLENDGTKIEDITLRAAMKLHGTVRTTKGDPVSGAWVRVGDFGGDEFRESLAITRADGTYRLGSLSGDKLQARVTSPKAGKADGQLAGKPGDDLEWNPTLSFGQRFSGRLVDERDTSLAGWSVQTSARIPGKADTFQCWTKTDAGGRFVIDNCPDQPMHFEIVEPPDERALAGLILENVRAATEEQVIRVPDSARFSATILGTLVDGDGLPLSASISISDTRSNHGNVLTTVKETGTFRCGPLAPGKYTLTAEIANDVRYRLGEFEVVRDQKMDLGRVVLARPGALAVLVKEGSTVDLRSCYFSIQSADREDHSTGKSGLGKDLSGKIELAPGKYFLRIEGDRIASASYSFEILSGQASRVEVDAKPGAGRSCRIASAPGSAVLTKVRIEVIDAKGTILEEAGPMEPWDDPPAIRITFSLAPGEYTVRATASDGRSGETKLAVDLEESRTMTEIQVR